MVRTAHSWEVYFDTYLYYIRGWREQGEKSNSNEEDGSKALKDTFEKIQTTKMTDNNLTRGDGRQRTLNMTMNQTQSIDFLCTLSSSKLPL